MKLSIIIPAYNEEKAIGPIIERTLGARKHIIEKAGIDGVEVIVVNDGSKDKTKEIAAKFDEVVLISYDKNRGYGAAIKTGFAKAEGELISFLDADGTCDPELFADLVSALLNNNAGIAIGSRLGPGNKMPRLRRLGNVIYAKIINFFGDVNITDCASGMRVLRKEALDKLYPLPDGMHFTPAMSSRALMSNEIKVVEVPIRYEERVGRSKLDVVKDGQRFLKIIFESILFYRPLKFFMAIGLFLVSLAALYAVNPVIYYLMNRRIEEIFIYRLLSIMVFGVAGVNFIMLGLLSDELVSWLNNRPGISSRIKNGLLKNILKPRNLAIIGFALVILGLALNVETIKEYIGMGKIYVHWVYVLVLAFLCLLGIQIVSYSFLQKILFMYRSDRPSQNERSRFRNERQA